MTESKRRTGVEFVPQDVSVTTLLQSLCLGDEVLVKRSMGSVEIKGIGKTFETFEWLSFRLVEVPAPPLGKPPPLPCGCHCKGGCSDPYSACASPCREHIPY